MFKPLRTGRILLLVLLLLAVFMLPAWASEDGWQTVGSAGFSRRTVSDTSLFVDQGVPYVAYVDVANQGKATVMKYDSGSWQAVGGPGFSRGIVASTSLFVDQGVPYVAYVDVANQGKATVMKYVVTPPPVASITAVTLAPPAALPVRLRISL